MIDLSTDKKVSEACKAFRVKQLHVFGSVASGNYNDSSDIDLLVEFDREGFEGAFDQFMGFKETMESILKRPVDLMANKRFRNVFFQKEVEKTKRLVYAA